MLWNLFAQLWQDEAGGVLATEYLMLGSIVAAGGTAGLVQMRDSMNDECKEFGQSVRQLQESYMPKPAGAANVGPSQGSQGSPVSYPVVGQPGGEQPTQTSHPTFSVP